MGKGEGRDYAMYFFGRKKIGWTLLDFKKKRVFDKITKRALVSDKQDCCGALIKKGPKMAAWMG